MDLRKPPPQATVWAPSRMPSQNRQKDIKRRNTILQAIFSAAAFGITPGRKNRDGVRSWRLLTGKPRLCLTAPRGESPPRPQDDLEDVRTFRGTTNNDRKRGRLLPLRPSLKAKGPTRPVACGKHVQATSLQSSGLCDTFWYDPTGSVQIFNHRSLILRPCSEEVSGFHYRFLTSGSVPANNCTPRSDYRETVRCLTKAEFSLWSLLGGIADLKCRTEQVNQSAT